MRLVWLLALGVPSLWGQVCPPARLLPTGTTSGTLDDSSCQLTDGTAYASYRLDLPVRGQIRIALSTQQDFLLILRDASGAKIDSGAVLKRPIEGGSYTLLVNARVPGQVGAWSVTSSFTAEPGLLCSAFPSLGLSQNVAGALGSSGCALPDGSLYEAYYLNTFGAGTLTVTVSSSDFSPAIFIRTPDGSAIVTGDATVTTPVDGDTRYQVVVTTSGKSSGSYQLATSFQPSDDDPCRAVKKLSGSDTDAGAITGDSCAATIPGSGDVAYYNYYLLNVGAPGVADLIVTSGEFGATIYLLDEGGNILATDSGGYAGGGSEVRMQLPAGSYTVEIVSSIPSGGGYQLRYQFTPGGPQPCAAATADASDTRSAMLSAGSCRTELGLADIYAMTLPSPGTLDLSLVANPSLTSALAIRDAKDNLVLMTQDVQGLGTTHLAADLPAGPYTVLAGAVSGGGSYQMIGKFSAHEIPSCFVAQPIDNNGGYVQKLGPGSCRGANGAPVDLYEFTLPADSMTAIVMTSSEIDGYLTLLDGSGSALRSDDNSYGYGDPLILQYLPAGTYRLAARAASGAAGGLYEVDVRSLPGPRPPFCAPRSTLNAGGRATGTVNFGSCQYPDGTFADIYKLDVPDSATLDLRLTSSDFDAYLVLLDAKGNLVDQDDDSGGGTNARINRLLAPGSYYVVAKTATDYTAAGSYILTVQ